MFPKSDTVTQTDSGRNKTLLVCEDNFLEKNKKN